MEESSSRGISQIFVNRDRELEEINQTVAELQDEQQLVKTPIIEYSGVQGIGKSTLLEQIERICLKENVACISENAIDITLQDFQQAMTLAESGAPVVVIVDHLDKLAGESSSFQEIESNLSKLLDHSRVFVVLASRGEQKFERTRSLKRKLTIRHLKPLEQKYCDQYMRRFEQAAQRAIEPEVRDRIFEWTHGYPLALKVMAGAIVTRGLDPRRSDEQKQLIDILVQEVVVGHLLAEAPPEDCTRLQRILALLSLPRRFNITLAQDLIETFAPEYSLGSSFAYIRLPQMINEVTNVLAYKLELIGYCIDTPVRNLFFLYSQHTDPSEFKKLHIFLAEQNRRFVQAVGGSDRVRYLREFFYHLAWYAEAGEVQENLTRYLTQLAQQIPTHDERTLVQALESGFLQFYDEFQRDAELQEALKAENTHIVYWLWYRNMLDIYRRIPENIQAEWLKHVFFLIANQSKKDDFSLLFEEGMRHITRQVPREKAIQLFNEFMREDQVVALLGAQLEKVRINVTDNLLEEGQ